MLSYYVAVGYSIVNPIIALLILIRSRRNVLSKLYSFCVLSLCTLGVVGYILGSPPPGFPVRVLEQITAFLYSLFPFFFLHFMLIFVRRYEILKSRSIILATYFVGMFSYVMVLLKLIPNPFASGISTSGYIYYLTWMSILFSVGVALMYSLIGGFSERGMKSNILFVAFTLLMLLLPTPFTQSLFSVFSGNSVALYFTSSIAALTILVYVVFRHRIVMNMPYQAMKTALEAMNDIVVKTDLEFRIEMAQGAVLSLLGYTEKELLGKNLSIIMDDKSRLQEFRDQVLTSKANAVSFEAEVSSKAQDRLQLDYSFTPVFANEEIVGFVGVGRNITEKKRLEAQLRQAQKMEILGSLAGGVAHDFNNLLTVVLANLSILERFKDDAEKARRSLDGIKSAVKRGAGIASQLLTFARKTEVSFENVDLNKFITDMLSMIESTFPKSINISTSVARESTVVWADVNQVSQALLNLCVNARDALEDTSNGRKEGGSLSIRTSVVEHAGLHTRFADADPGRYVDVTVADDGVGMNEETKNRIFEPFFSTKGPGKGTGLGLAVVYGVMRGHHGFIDVESAFGKGTTFHLYFPAQTQESQEKRVARDRSGKLHGAGETLLIVEDEEMLLESFRTSFEDRGYKVLTASDGEEAMKLSATRGAEISLVLLDVDLPKINGAELYKLMKAAKPGLRVIFCTGSIDPAFEARMREVGANGVIRKPYTLDEVARRIRNVLDSDRVDV